MGYLFSNLLVFMSTSGLQIPDKNYLIKYKDVMSETIEGYNVAYERKKQILYSRMDDSMIKRLREIRRKTGISVSEIIRESVRRLLKEIDETGSINLKI
jgi:hypothetical protein